MTTKKEFSGRFEETGKNIDKMVSNASETLRKERQDLKNKWNALDKKRTDVADDDNNAWRLPTPEVVHLSLYDTRKES